MDYKQQKFEGAFETPQMPNGKYQKKAKKKEITARTQINDSAQYTENLRCFTCNYKYLFLIMVIKKF